MYSASGGNEQCEFYNSISIKGNLTLDTVINQIACSSMRPSQGQDRQDINEILISIWVHYVAKSEWN